MEIDLSYVQRCLDWMKRVFYLNTTVENAKRRAVKRGCVYKCELGIGIGSEMQKERPCIVISNNGANKTSPNVILIPITHDTDPLPCLVPLKTYTDITSNIILDGCANTACITCVSKARLGNLITQLDKYDLKNIEDSLEVSLGMTHRTTALKDEITRLRNYIGRIKDTSLQTPNNE